MPLQTLERLGSYEPILLWHITESESDLSAMAGGDVCPRKLSHPRRRKEWFAGRLLARELATRAGVHYRGLGAYRSGKPFLKGCPHWISLSHSFPYAVAQVCDTHPVGVDLERPCGSLRKISSRVLSPLERGHAGEDIIKLCVYWCAKESLYKMYGWLGMSFAEDLQIAPFRFSDEGDLVGSVEQNGVRRYAHFHYRVYTRFVLVYSVRV